MKSFLSQMRKTKSLNKTHNVCMTEYGFMYGFTIYVQEFINFGLRLKLVFLPTNKTAKSLPNLKHIKIPITFADLKKEKCYKKTV